MTAQEQAFSFNQIINNALAYKRQLLVANTLAIIAAILSVPIPLILPLMVDEVLLNQPGVAIEWMNQVLPENWHTAVIYISLALIFCLIDLSDF